MPIAPVDKKYTTGDIFHRTGFSSPAFFTDTVFITNAGKVAVYWPPGTPVATNNLLAANGLVSVQKLVYVGVTLQPGVRTPVCVIDVKVGQPFNAPASPVNFAGIKINLTKLPLSVQDANAANSQRTYLIANWRALLSNGKWNVSFFEESTRYDPIPT